MRSVGERKTRSRAAARQAQRPARDLPKVQPGTARRGKAKKQSFFARFVPSKTMVAFAAIGTVLVLLLALAVTGVLGRAFHGAKTATDTVSADAGFSIRAIHISCIRRTPLATITAALDLRQDQSIFSADLAAARASLMALDCV